MFHWLRLLNWALQTFLFAKIANEIFEQAMKHLGTYFIGGSSLNVSLVVKQCFIGWISLGGPQPMYAGGAPTSPSVSSRLYDKYTDAGANLLSAPTTIFSARLIRLFTGHN